MLIAVLDQLLGGGWEGKVGVTNNFLSILDLTVRVINDDIREGGDTDRITKPVNYFLNRIELSIFNSKLTHLDRETCV